MEAENKKWFENLKSRAESSAQAQQADHIVLDTPLTPLVQRLKKFIDGLPAEVRNQPKPLEFFRQGLLGRQPGNNAHAGELGSALRKLHYVRKRGWQTEDGGFRALWYPQK